VAEAGHGEAYSPDELRGLIEASREQGTVRKHEHDMLGAILDLERVEVVEVMTHRRNMVSLDGDAPVAEIARQVLDGPHTRYPVWRGDRTRSWACCTRRTCWARCSAPAPRR
jgi:Mg2+/Co2+ transporter CorB